MKKIKFIFIMLLLPVLAMAQFTGGNGRGDYSFSYTDPVVVTASAGTAGPATYLTLKAAFDAINLGTHKGSITVKINTSITETASAVLNASGSGTSPNISDYTAVHIYPTATGLSISGNINYSPIIDLNGADSVTIDGRVNAVGSTVSLVISNASTSSWYSTSTIRFTNDATYNIIKYCKLQGSTTAGDQGILSFYRVAIASGNSYNTIDHNEITNAGGNRPRNALFSFGKSEAVPNSSITVTNNNFYDVLNLNQNYTKAIALYTSEDAHPNNSYNTGWTISGNSFYDTQDFPTTNSGGDAKVIFVWASQGSGFTISNNYIGGNAPLCSGTWTKTNGNIAFVAIFLNVNDNGTANYIQGNTIKNFNYANSGNYGWNGIYFNSGANNVTDNCIGASTGTGSIIFTTGSSDGGFTGISQGIYCSSTCSNNTIGSITVANSNQAYATNFTGIWVSSYCGSGTTSNNIIGSTTTPNSINTTSASSSNAQTLVGIKIQGGATHNIANNTVANLTNGTTNTSTSTQGYIYGIYAYQGINTINGNTVHDLTIANANTARGPINTSGNPTLSLSAGGLVAPIYSNITQAISGNTIYNISNTNSSFAGTIAGLYYSGKESSNTDTIAQNFIYNLSVNASSNAASLYGIKIAGGLSTYANNIINLDGNNWSYLYGIYDESGTNNVYFNSVYIYGSTPAGTDRNSFCLYSNASNTRTYKNNIFVNNRVSGYINACVYISSLSNLIIDYNDYYYSGGGNQGVGMSAVQIYPTFAAFKGYTQQDLNSKNADPVFETPGGTTAADYKPSEMTLVATTGTGITTDYAGTVTRSSTYPSMGAWEFAVTPPCANPDNGGEIDAAQTICSGTSPAGLTNKTTPTGFTGTLQYKWQSSITSASTDFTEIGPGATGEGYSLGALTATTWFKRLVKVTCGSIWLESNVIEITVDPVSVGGSITGGTTVCSGTNSTSLSLGGYTGTVIKWQMTTDNWVTPVDIANTTNACLASGLTATTKYRAIVQSGVCEADTSADATVVVSQYFTPSVISVITSGTNPTCPAESVTFTATPVNGGLNPSYEWFKNGISAGSTVSYTFNPTDGDEVYVVMTTSVQCFTALTATSTTTTMQVTGSAPASVTIRAARADGGQVKFTAYPVNGGATPIYTWYKNGVPIPGITGPVLISTCQKGDEHKVVLTSSLPCTSPATSETMCTN